MGCGHSSQMGTSPKVSPMKANISQAYSRSSSHIEVSHPCSSMFPDFLRILNGISEIYRPQFSYFVLCLSNDSIPLSGCSIKHLFEKEVGIHLPTIGIARYEQGRILCLGNISFLVNNKSDEGEILSFLENMMNFVAGNVLGPMNVLLLDLYPKDADCIQRIFRDFRCNFEIASDLKDKNLSKYSFIFIMSHCTYCDEIYEYIRNGGGLVCSASFQDDNPKKQFYINKALSRCGIAFTPIQKKLKFRPKNVTQTIIDPEELEQLTFPHLVNQYVIQLESETEISLIRLAEIVTNFRIHLAAFERSNSPLFEEILFVSCNYLEKTNFRQQEGVFHSEIHQLISIVLSDLFTKLSPELLTSEIALKCVEPISGHFKPEKLETASITLDIQFAELEWYSTGLWLPAGVISEVKIQPQYFDNLSIQIGSHSESLLCDRVPYKRWPIVTQIFPLTGKKGTIQIASQFGGLIYIVINELKKTAARSQQIRVHFTNVCKSYYFKTKEGNSENSYTDISNKNELPPWGEIQTKFVCFTLPLEEILKISDVQDFCKYFDNLVSEMLMFIGFKPSHLFRIVFDVHSLVDGSTTSYPIVLSHEIVKGIFLYKEPTSELFAALMKIAIISFPEDALNPNVEAAFSALAVAHIFNKKWPNISPEDFTYINLIPLFMEIWDIYKKKGPRLFSAALLAFQQAQAEKKTSYKESIEIIVNKMSSMSNENYSYIIDDALNISNVNSHELPSYNFEEEENENEN